MPPTLIAVDLGGTHMRVAAFDGDSPEPFKQAKVPTEAENGPTAVIGRMKDAIADLMPDDAAGVRIGVGAPGPLDPTSGIVFDAPNLPGWTEVPLKAALAERFDVPVAIGNDANLAALGEWRYGAGRGTSHMVYVTVSTGIGGGIIVDGQLLLGSRGLGAEIGHITVADGGAICGCGQPGHLEALASGTAIAQSAANRLQAGEASSLAALSRMPTSQEVGEAAIAGDPLALGVIDSAAEYLGKGLASILHLFNPQMLVFGGGVSALGGFLFDRVRNSLAAHVMSQAYLVDLDLRPAQLGDDAGLVGAMVLAAQLPD